MAQMATSRLHPDSQSLIDAINPAVMTLDQNMSLILNFDIHCALR
jgi:hypothetical protein